MVDSIMNVESIGYHHSISYMVMMMMMMIKIVNSAVTAVPSFLREGSNQAIRYDEITMMIFVL